MLRFFRNLNLADVGVAMGVSERAAQKRVNRALETPPINQDASSVVVTARDEISEECAAIVAKRSRQISEALTLTGLPNSWIGLRAVGLEGRQNKRRSESPSENIARRDSRG